MSFFPILHNPRLPKLILELTSLQKTVKASVALTIDTQPTSGDTFTIGDKTYIFVPVGTDNGNGEISIGADLAAAQAAIVAAINGTDDHNTPHPLVFADDFADDAADITAFIGGTIGNAIATTETFTAATNIFSAVTLGGGNNCSAADAALAVIAAVNGNDSSLCHSVCRNRHKCCFNL